MKSLILFFLLLFVPWVAIAAITPNDPAFPTQWYLQAIRAPEAWQKTTGSRQIVVAALDTGIAVGHPDLYENIWVNLDEIPFNNIDDDKNGYVDDVRGWDFLENKPHTGPDLKQSTTSSLHHGTLVAGLIGAVGNNATDGAGVAWQVQIMPLRVLDSQGAGDPAIVARAIDYAVKEKTDIISLSFISNKGEKLPEKFYQAIQRAHEAGVTMVAAAGNDAADDDLIGGDLDFNPRYPVCYDGPQGEPWWVIGVAAVDENDLKSPFSDYGFKCVDISAPGSKMPGTLMTLPGQPQLSQSFGGSWSGTSLATPLVAGAAALIKSLRPDLGPKEIYYILTQSADKIDNKNPFYLAQLGAGRLNLVKALDLVEKMPLPPSPEKILLIRSASSPTKLAAYDFQGQSVVFFPEIKKQKFKKNPDSVKIDLDGDGQLENISALAKGKIKIKSVNPLLNKTFVAYNKYQRKVIFNIEDWDGDGALEIITAPLEKNPIIKIWTFAGEKKQEFLIKGDYRRGLYLKFINL